MTLPPAASSYVAGASRTQESRLASSCDAVSDVIGDSTMGSRCTASALAYVAARLGRASRRVTLEASGFAAEGRCGTVPVPPRRRRTEPQGALLGCAVPVASGASVQGAFGVSLGASARGADRGDGAGARPSICGCTTSATATWAGGGTGAHDAHGAGLWPGQSGCKRPRLGLPWAAVAAVGQSASVPMNGASEKVTASAGGAVAGCGIGAGSTRSVGGRRRSRERSEGHRQEPVCPHHLFGGDDSSGSPLLRHADAFSSLLACATVPGWRQQSSNL